MKKLALVVLVVASLSAVGGCKKKDVEVEKVFTNTSSAVQVQSTSVKTK